MPVRHLLILLGFLTALLPGPTSAQEIARQDDPQALQANFAWAVEATRDYIARAEGWPESDFTIILKVDNSDQPRTVIARVVRPGNPFSAFPECPISPPVCWNELHFAVETRKVFYMIWGN
jgi:hypothetical protein